MNVSCMSQNRIAVVQATVDNVINDLLCLDGECKTNLTQLCIHTALVTHSTGQDKAVETNRPCVA